MKSVVGVVGAWCVCSVALLLAQGAGSAPLAADATAPDIPGVVAAGARVQVLQSWDPALGGEAPISMPDGTLLFSQQDLGRVIKIGSDGTFSTYLDTKPNQVLGMAYDLKGRLIAAHRGEPNGLLVLAPERSVLAESFDGQAFCSPNDLGDRPEGRRLFYGQRLGEDLQVVGPPRRQPSTLLPRCCRARCRVTEVPSEAQWHPAESRRDAVRGQRFGLPVRARRSTWRPTAA